MILKEKWEFGKIKTNSQSVSNIRWMYFWHNLHAKYIRINCIVLKVSLHEKKIIILFCVTNLFSCCIIRFLFWGQILKFLYHWWKLHSIECSCWKSCLIRMRSVLSLNRNLIAVWECWNNRKYLLQNANQVELWFCKETEFNCYLIPLKHFWFRCVYFYVYVLSVFVITPQRIFMKFFLCW